MPPSISPSSPGLETGRGPEPRVRRITAGQVGMGVKPGHARVMARSIRAAVSGRDAALD